MDQDRIFQLALHFIPGIGNVLVKQLISYCGSAESVFSAPKSQLLKIPGIGPASANAIRTQKPLQKAEDELEKTGREGVHLLFHHDKPYPHRLKHIHDAPSLLYHKGNTDLNAHKIVAIVGTRQATSYGKALTETLVEGLVPHGALVVSGLAYGIDIQAHRAALKYGLPTLAVLAGGLDKIYPAAHKGTARDMQISGGILTEQCLGTVPEPPKFPARNRIIAGLADAIIIVEAAKRGGALITAEMANDYNRDVFAIPGEVGRKYSEGCNNLVKKNKAHLLTGISDLEYIMNWDKEDTQTSPVPLSLDHLDPDEKKVMAELENGTQVAQIDQLSWSTQIPVNKLASVLLTLEFQGLVKALPGNNYKRVK